jgi:hypothetical protein
MLTGAIPLILKRGGDGGRERRVKKCKKRKRAVSWREAGVFVAVCNG